MVQVLDGLEVPGRYIRIRYEFVPVLLDPLPQPGDLGLQLVIATEHESILVDHVLEHVIWYERPLTVTEVHELVVVSPFHPGILGLPGTLHVRERLEIALETTGHGGEPPNLMELSVAPVHRQRTAHPRYVQAHPLTPLTIYLYAPTDTYVFLLPYRFLVASS